MNFHERVYRSLLVLYPEAHRREYGEPMVQLVGDLFRDERGGLRTLRLWCQIIGDLVRAALSERMEMTMDTLKDRWWRMAAGLMSFSIACVAIANVFTEWTGGVLLVRLGPAFLAILGMASVFGGLVVRRRNAARGSTMIGVGLLPGVTLMAVFWSPILVAVGTIALILALTAFVNAMIERPARLTDEVDARR
ncbi:MAG: hypothetical protein M3P87_06145 [Actinomycetota bacterium]|nr:hypothetical protein [Actinomycetota bacterium]